MKRIFSFLVALILVSSSFGVVAAQENLRSVDEIKAEIREVQWELDMEILKNQTSHRTTDKTTHEEQMQKELSLLPLQNKLWDLKYDLAVTENRTINMEELINSLKNQSQMRSVNYDGVFLEAWDILLFYGDSSSSSFDIQWLKNYIFDKKTRGWSHALLVLDNWQGLHIWNNVNSQIIPVQDALDIIDYKRTVVKRIPLSVRKKIFLPPMLGRF